MKEFIEKLIGRLEERKQLHNRMIAYEQKSGTVAEEFQQRKAVEVLDDAIEIVNQLAEEYKNKAVKGDSINRSALIDVMWDVFNQYCNDADRFDEYETEAINRAFKLLQSVIEKQPTTNDSWIPCSERLPQENEPVDTVCEVVNVMMKSGTVTSGWCNRYIERWYVLDEHCDYPLQQNYEDVIAWQPLPEPYQPKGE